MKEHPILFSGPMVRAILDGRKTQTRRVVKGVSNANCIPVRGATVRRGTITHVLDAAPQCPYGQSGDRLWVRETWAHAPAAVFSKRDEDGPFVYAADGNDQRRTCTGNWRPSIHMPRSASRLTLEVTGVRVERVQDITRVDAIAEGFAGERSHTLEDAWIETPERQFLRAIYDLNKRVPQGSNPWVWVIEFRKVA